VTSVDDVVFITLLYTVIEKVLWQMAGVEVYCY